MAIDFNGTTDRIDVANSFNWQSQAQTWAAWTWWDSLDAGTEYLFCDNNAADSVAVLVLLRAANDTSLRYTIVTDGADADQVTHTGNFLTTGSWIHIAATWNGAVGANTTDAVVYANGADAGDGGSAAANGTGTPTAATGLNSLGGRSFDDLRNFDGRLAEVGRWNRVLSAGDIAGLAKGYSPKCFPSGLKFYMPLVRSTHNVCSGGAVTLDGTSVIAHPPIARNPRKRAA
jgi:hypothetical protein